MAGSARSRTWAASPSSCARAPGRTSTAARSSPTAGRLFDWCGQALRLDLAAPGPGRPPRPPRGRQPGGGGGGGGGAPRRRKPLADAKGAPSQDSTGPIKTHHACAISSATILRTSATWTLVEAV
ncbi:MAG: hypothetical protein FP826_03435 [Sphingomonadales bacterium]|nr:hypothetical protein [Sphingomonadales bacterium]